MTAMAASKAAAAGGKGRPPGEGAAAAADQKLAAQARHNGETSVDEVVVSCSEVVTVEEEMNSPVRP